VAPANAVGVLDIFDAKTAAFQLNAATGRLAI